MGPACNFYNWLRTVSESLIICLLLLALIITHLTFCHSKQLNFTTGEKVKNKGLPGGTCHDRHTGYVRGIFLPYAVLFRGTIDLWWNYPELHPGAEISKGVMVNFILLRG